MSVTGVVKSEAALETQINVIDDEVSLGANSKTRIAQLMADLNATAFDKITNFPYTKSTVEGVLGQYISNRVTISSAEILALNTTPKTLLVAQGANKVIAPHSITFSSAAGTAYTTNLSIEFSVDGATWTSLLGTSILSGTTATIRTHPIPEHVAIANNSFRISVAGGNPAAGDFDVSAILTYSVIDFS